MEPVLIVAPFSVESHSVFLSMKRGLLLFGVNPCALIQSSMHSQLDHDMLREADPKVSMDSITLYQARTWGVAKFWTDKFKKAEGEFKKAQAKCTNAE